MINKNNNGKKWFSVKAEADRADIYIFGEIGDWGITAQDFIQELNEHKDKALTVHINSGGGSVFDGQAIHSALKSHKGHVKVSIEGLAASIATIIAMGGDTIEMTENSLYMVHSPSIGAHGNKKEISQALDILNKIEETMISTYKSKTGKKESEILEMLENETWLNAEEALAGGFVDFITEEVEVAANFDAGKFNSKTEDEILSVLNGKGNLIKTNDDMNEENKNWFVAQLDKFANKILGQSTEGVEPTPVEATPVEPTVVEEPNVVEEVNPLQAQVDALTQERDALLEASRVAEEEQVDYGAEIAAMRQRISQLEATPSTALGSDPAPIETPAPEKTGWDNMVDEIFG